MEDRFRKRIKVTTLWHFGVVIVLMIVPALYSWHLHRADMDSLTFVDFTVAIPGDTSLPPPQSLDDLAKPEPKQEAKSEVTEPSPGKTKIQKSTKLVKRPAPQGGTTKKSNLSMEEIRRLLAAGARISDHDSIPDNYVEVGYYQKVRKAMYDAWNQPGGLSASAGLVAEVRIRVTRAGLITQREMTRASGNSMMDESVMSAVNTVSQLPPLPPQFSGAYKDITIQFELTHGAM